MRRLLLLPVMLLALAFAGCQSTDLGKFVTTPIVNPVSQTNTYQAKVWFAGSQELVLKYQQDCFGSQLPPYPVSWARIKSDPILAVQCKHRVSRYNTMKKAEDRAYVAIITADNFVAQNPTGNAVSYIAAAYRAVNEYRAKVGG